VAIARTEVRRRMPPWRWSGERIPSLANTASARPRALPGASGSRRRASSLRSRSTVRESARSCRPACGCLSPPLAKSPCAAGRPDAPESTISGRVNPGLVRATAKKRPKGLRPSLSAAQQEEAEPRSGYLSRYRKARLRAGKIRPRRKKPTVSSEFLRRRASSKNSCEFWKLARTGHSCQSRSCRSQAQAAISPAQWMLDAIPPIGCRRIPGFKVRPIELLKHSRQRSSFEGLR
jgi:hypothetical protein